MDINYPALLEVAGSYKSFASGDGYQAGAYAIDWLATSGWSAYDEVVIEFDKKLPAPKVTLEQKWKDVIDYKIGGFYTFTDYFKVRGGYYKQPVLSQSRHWRLPLQTELGEIVSLLVLVISVALS